MTQSPEQDDRLPSGIARTNGETIHDELLHELEDHSPEGRGIARPTTRRELFLIISLAMIAIIGGGIALHCLGGWTAVLIGALLFAVYYLLGWWPYLEAGLLRRKERRRFEEIVESEIDERESDRAEQP